MTQPSPLAQIESLRRDQNQDLLSMLEREQAAEEARERMMARVKTTVERGRLEKIFGQERARASERIMNMTEEHEETLARRMTELSVWTKTRKKHEGILGMC